MVDKYEDIITNSIKYRFMEKSFNQSNLFKNELIVLLNSFSEIDITLNSLDDIKQVKFNKMSVDSTFYKILSHLIFLAKRFYNLR